VKARSYDEFVAIKSKIDVVFLSRILVAACSESILRRRSLHVNEAGETVLGSCNRGTFPDGVVADTRGCARNEDKLSWP